MKKLSKKELTLLQSLFDHGSYTKWYVCLSDRDKNILANLAYRLGLFVG